jgi:S1-C subfamily serine protease
MDRIPSSLLSRLRYKVACIGRYKTTPEDYGADPFGSHLEVMGTGFLVAPGILMTARHVAKGLRDSLEKDYRPKTHAFAAFDHTHDNALAFTVAPVHGIWFLEDHDRDVGLVVTNHPPGVDTDLLPIQTESEIRLGDPVAVLGYPQRQNCLERENAEGVMRLYRFGAVLQRGHVSGFAPHEVATFVDRYLLDIATSTGMSGGPVIDVRRQVVIGVHTGGFQSTAETAFAYPLSHERVTEFLANHSTAKSHTRDKVPIPAVKAVPAGAD